MTFEEDYEPVAYSRQEEISNRFRGQLTSVIGLAAMFSSEAVPHFSSSEDLSKGLIFGGVAVGLKGLGSQLRAMRHIQLLDYREMDDDFDYEIEPDSGPDSET